MVVGEKSPTHPEERFPRGELLHVLGVDVLLDFKIRDYRVLRTGLGDEQSAREVLTLLDGSNSVILTEKFLRRHGLRVGDDIRLVFRSTEQSFTIRGVLLNQGPNKRSKRSRPTRTSRKRCGSPPGSFRLVIRIFAWPSPN
jgi:hypothetical protein